MKAAQITKWGETPKYVDIPPPPTPPPGSDLVQVRVLAAGIHRLVRGRAEGTHFSATTLPHIPGSDGVGRTVPDGELVYFPTFWEKGSMLEYINVPRAELTRLPDDADPVRVAGLANPALASWMALRARVVDPPKAFTVLVVGATSFAGAIALSLSRTLGAGKVLGCARNEKAMAAMGYDGTIALREPVEETDFAKAADVDVVLDFVYGPAIVHLFKSITPTSPVQYVQIGSLSAGTIDLPGALLRAKNLTLRGAAPGAYTMEEQTAQMPELVRAVDKIQNQPFKVVALKDIEAEWADTKTRIVVRVAE